ncbi:Protein-tyrosine-phosphatase [Paenibacillus sp. UNCCL117]|uniref:arsenate reductase/protein-tyrosine-phosphatase family protein n=1 Tax=unclassified Paenibacillus TaxID=185978 RepID=UPI0008830976|nr:MULTISPECIES: hypothetical protein [unclassified Paenibacillus]SDD72540.1 Protein-tyrosine-phosphatase [Paenibacillus sp. cl123]SFW45741.1 Protein-tyrosine-phosphatase [Paenibacillus sp. UNCCL117]
MKILFLCTDNFTRSIIAEYCLKDYLLKNHIQHISVSSAGIRANSDISKYSRLHFEILKEMDIDTSEWSRTPFSEDFFIEYDLIIGMSELHIDFIKQEYDREISLFNKVYNGLNTPVNIGSPDSPNFEVQMRALVQYFKDAMPSLLKNIEKMRSN